MLNTTVFEQRRHDRLVFPWLHPYLRGRFLSTFYLFIYLLEIDQCIYSMFTRRYNYNKGVSYLVKISVCTHVFI